ncbi:uncharacterized protein C3orf85 homolog [Elgaria multicarinata webbii]|uniref:uncharacterized protein C3orf85 homolog n=1 Tax=Elgaria multicarinata webbii TaxID=159646 RepID=UPI002FCD3998
MATTMLGVAMCAVLLTGVLGRPFVSENEANQFLGLKRQTPLFNIGTPTISQFRWGTALADKAGKTWEALKKSGQYYLDFGSYAFHDDKARDHLSSYMDLFHQSGEDLPQQRRKREIVRPEPIIDPWCP